MILRNIEESGIVLTSFWGYGDKFNPDCLSRSTGIGKAGVFYEICEECDNTVFQSYENIDALLEKPNSKMLKLIALKNNLYGYYKHRIECKATPIIAAGAIGSDKLTLRNYNWTKEFEQKIANIISRLDDDSDDMYKILFWQKLNYKVPIAYQGLFALNINFKGEILNDFHPTVHMMIFPINNECSIVCLFCENNEMIIKNIGFSSMLRTNDDILSHINTLLLLYSEDYFISKHLKNLLSDDDYKKLEFLCYKLEATSKGIPYLLNLRRNVIINHNQFPNLLSEKYQIKE